MSDDVRVPCRALWTTRDVNGMKHNHWCKPDALCPNCTELLALRRRVEDWRSWVAGIIGFDHMTTGKTDSHMRQDVNDEIQRLIDRVGEVEVAGAKRVAELEATAARRLELLRELRDSFCAAAKLPCREPNVKIIREMGHYLRLLDRVDAEISAAAEVAADSP